LRVKAKRIEVKKDTNKLKDIKESELNLESRNRNSIMTNKNEEYIPKNNNEVIFIKKKIIRTEKNKNKNPNNIHSLKEKNVFCNSNSNTVKGHKQLQITVKKNKDNKTEKETVLSDDKRDNEDKAIERNRKRNIVFMNNNDKKNSTLKSSMNSNEQKTKFKNKIINLGDVSSERDIIVNRKTYAPIISTIKKDK
jgi:hypothetical protein